MFMDMRRCCRGVLPGGTRMMGVLDDLALRRHAPGKFGMLGAHEHPLTSLARRESSCLRSAYPGGIPLRRYP